MTERNWEFDLQRMKEKAIHLAQETAAAASRAANSAKLSVQIAAEEERLNRAYQALGKLYYQDITAGVVTQGPWYQQQLDNIAQSLEKIRQLRSQKEPASDLCPVPQDAPQANPEDFAEPQEEQESTML